MGYDAAAVIASNGNRLTSEQPGFSVSPMNDKDHLIALAYPGGREALDIYVAARIDAGASWRKIRDEVNAFFNGGVTVTHEWLRQQYGRAAA